jgi:hypothetical protein
MSFLRRAGAALPLLRTGRRRTAKGFAGSVKTSITYLSSPGFTLAIGLNVHAGKAVAVIRPGQALAGRRADESP